MLEEMGSDTIRGRRLFVLDAPDIADLRSLAALPCKHFACFLAWDADLKDIAAISRVAEALLDAGAVCIASWGRTCELVHDVIDEVLVEREVTSGLQQPHILTTWHSKDSFAKALWFLTFVLAPNDSYLETCKATVAIAIGSSEYAAELRSAFRDPSAINRALL